MIPLQILAVGRLGEPWMNQACQEYLKRIGGYSKAAVTELPEARLPSQPSPAQVQQALGEEAERFQKKIPSRAFRVALCIEGKQMSSPQLAKTLEQTAQEHPEAVFLIGSSHGLDDSLKKEAHLCLSFSEMTFPHQLARVILLEQLYRAASILHGGKYHK